MRFSDLLSKFVNMEQSERHRSLAQEIITLLDMLNPNDEEIQHVMGTVLSSTSNYLASSIAFLIFRKIMFLTVCQMK